MTAGKATARDLEADLAVCEAARPGPWMNLNDSVAVNDWKTSERPWVCQMYEGYGSDAVNFDQQKVNAKFIAEARQGWPYAIRRALEAEAEIDRLRNELNILQEQLHGGV